MSGCRGGRFWLLVHRSYSGERWSERRRSGRRRPITGRRQRLVAVGLRASRPSTVGGGLLTSELCPAATAQDAGSHANDGGINASRDHAGLAMLATAIMSVGVAFALLVEIFVFVWTVARYVPSDRGFHVKVSIVPLSIAIEFSSRGDTTQV